MFFLYIFFVHNAHTVDFEIYNIHSFSLKQSRVFFVFFLGIRPHSLTVNVACRFTVRDQKEGGFFFFFFFIKQTEQRTRTRRNTHHDDQRNAGIARILLQRSLMPPLQGGAMMSPTQTALLLLFSRELYRYRL